MSMKTVITYGYGFVVCASDEALRSFVLNHKDTIRKFRAGEALIEYTENNQGATFNPKEDFFDWSVHSSDEGFYGIIADVMREETGITFEYVNDSDEDIEYILFLEGYPWQLNDAERDLTEEKLETICKKFIAELGISSTPDYQEVEYFG